MSHDPSLSRKFSRSARPPPKKKNQYTHPNGTLRSEGFSLLCVNLVRSRSLPNSSSLAYVRWGKAGGRATREGKKEGASAGTWAAYMVHLLPSFSFFPLVRRLPLFVRLNPITQYLSFPPSSRPCIYLLSGNRSKVISVSHLTFEDFAPTFSQLARVLCSATITHALS